MKTDKTPGHIKLDEKMEVSDGGRLELKTPLSKGTWVVLFVVRKSPDDLSDLTEASENALGFRNNPIDDEEWNDA
ncbi:MAG: hypothetical protein U9N07_09640 [Euryarchaeota archaeon]|nr:hypothetical protein [Euryarchaeota archaeon]